MRCESETNHLSWEYVNTRVNYKSVTESLYHFKGMFQICPLVTNITYIGIKVLYTSQHAHEIT